MTGVQTCALPIFITLHKIQVQVDKDLSIKPDILNLTEEKVVKSLEHIGTGDNFLNRPPMAQALRSRVDNWDLMELQSFCKAKVIVNKANQQPTDGEKSSLTPHLIEG